MKRPQPDLEQATVGSFIALLGKSRKLNRLWGTEVVAGSEVLTERQFYHPVHFRQGYDGQQPMARPADPSGNEPPPSQAELDAYAVDYAAYAANVAAVDAASNPKEFEKLFKFLKAYKDVTEASTEGLTSAWVYFNRNKKNRGLSDPNQFVADNLNLVFWDPADGEQPEDITLTTSIVIERSLEQIPDTVISQDAGDTVIINDVPTTPLLNPGMTEAQMIQVIQTNYDTLWDTCKIVQEGVGVINKGTYKDPITTLTLPDEDDLSPDDPWLDVIARYALKTNGIDCTIKSVALGIREGDNPAQGRTLYNSYVVTLEIPARTFINTLSLFISEIANDIEIDHPRRKGYISNSNPYYTRQAVLGMESSDLSDDSSLINRPYTPYGDASIASDPRYESVWVQSGHTWYLRADAFATPQAYGLTHKEFAAYVFSIIDQGYKKKRVSRLKKAIGIIIFIIIVVANIATGGALTPLLVAQYIVLAGVILALLTLVASALGADEWAAAFAAASKEMAPLVTVASVFMIINPASLGANLATAAGREAAMQAVIDYAKNFVKNMIDGIIQGAVDVMAGNFTTNAALMFMDKAVQLASMPMKNKIKDLNSKNVDLLAEYEHLRQEMGREYDVLAGFASVYAMPATADASIYSSLFDAPYEKGGGPMSLGGIQRTTKQALRKGSYADPAFDNILVV